MSDHVFFFIIGGIRQHVVERGRTRRHVRSVLSNKKSCGMQHTLRAPRADCNNGMRIKKRRETGKMSRKRKRERERKMLMC